MVGRALEVEFTLRGLAAATTEDQYLESLVDRFDFAADGLAEILDLEQIPALTEIRNILSDVSPKANNRGPMMAADSYEPPSARLDIILKDAGIIAAHARSVGVTTPLLDCAIPIYQQGSDAGYGDMDAASLRRFLDDLNEGQ